MVDYLVLSMFDQDDYNVLLQNFNYKVYLQFKFTFIYIVLETRDKSLNSLHRQGNIRLKTHGCIIRNISWKFQLNPTSSLEVMAQTKKLKLLKKKEEGEVFKFMDNINKSYTSFLKLYKYSCISKTITYLYNLEIF